MASQSTTNASSVRGPTSVSSSPSSPPTVQQPFSSAIPTPTSASPSSPVLSTSQQSQASFQQSGLTAKSVSLSSASQIGPTSTVTSLLLPPTVIPSPSQIDNSGGANTPRPEADQRLVPLRMIIPVTTAIAGLFVLLLLLYSYRRYQRRQQLKQAPLPAKRTPIILERRRAQMYRFEMAQTSNHSLVSPVAVPPRNLGTSSYIPFPSKGSNISDGSHTHPSLTSPLASVSALLLERQPSMVSPSTSPHELANTDNYPTGPLEFLQQPFTPPYARRQHSRAVSIVSVASRHSAHSLATMRSGQHTGSGSNLRGAPHKNNLNIVLPQPLAPKNHSYDVQYGEPPSLHSQHTSFMGGISPPSWNGHGELRHRSNASKDRMHEGEWTYSVTSLSLCLVA
jgi:hypothetical protein